LIWIDIHPEQAGDTTGIAQEKDTMAAGKYCFYYATKWYNNHNQSIRTNVLTVCSAIFCSVFV
jgi:hypothetical protein